MHDVRQNEPAWLLLEVSMMFGTHYIHWWMMMRAGLPDGEQLKCKISLNCLGCPKHPAAVWSMFFCSS